MSDTSTKRAEEIAYNLQLSGVSGSTWRATEVDASNMLRALAAERDALRAENDKLRAENAKLAASNHAYLSDYQEAAAEIEKLRAERRAMQGALLAIKAHTQDARPMSYMDQLCRIARAALGEKDDAKV
jgi:cell division protein FtsB